MTPPPTPQRSKRAMRVCVAAVAIAFAVVIPTNATAQTQPSGAHDELLERRKEALHRALGTDGGFDPSLIQPAIVVLGLGIGAGVWFLDDDHRYNDPLSLTSTTPSNGIDGRSANRFVGAGSLILSAGSAGAYTLGPESRWSSPLFKASLYVGLGTAMLGIATSYRRVVRFGPDYDFGPTGDFKLALGLTAGAYYSAAVTTLAREALAPSPSVASLRRDARTLYNASSRANLEASDVAAIEARVLAARKEVYGLDVLPMFLATTIQLTSALSADDQGTRNAYAIGFGTSLTPLLIMGAIALKPSLGDLYTAPHAVTITAAPGGVGIAGRF